MTGRIIRDHDDLSEGAAFLRKADPRLAPHLDTLKPLPLRLKPEGYPQLLSAIIGQQVSTASAAAVWGRLEAEGLCQPDAVASTSDDALRGCGLSRQKIRYARALAEADIDYRALREMTDQEVIKTLTAVTGIGRWTADIYLMFSLGRANGFAAGDLAIQIAAQDMLGLPERPSDRQLREIAEIWSPWRSVAARLMWAYYRVIKQRDGIR